MRYIGIDPGQSGGIGILTFDGPRIGAEAFKMPSTDRELFELLRSLGVFPERTKACVERVHSFPGQGVASSFTFGMSYGAILMGLAATGISYDLVMPRRWQGELGCLSGGDKNVTKRRAQGMFPDLKITHATADSLLIAEFCRRLDVGTVKPPTRIRHGQKGE